MTKKTSKKTKRMNAKVRDAIICSMRFDFDSAINQGQNRQRAELSARENAIQTYAFEQGYNAEDVRMTMGPLRFGDDD